MGEPEGSEKEPPPFDCRKWLNEMVDCVNLEELHYTLSVPHSDDLFRIFGNSWDLF